MNAKELETQHNLKKWAAIIKECRSSGMKILQWLEINNISKDQYYYWQKKLKETCIDTFERQAATFVELPVTKEVTASTELTVTHTVCKNDDSYFKEATSGSLLLSTLALISAMFEDEFSFKIIQEIQKEKLSHCNFQFWFPREKSENIMLRSPDRFHGACWSSVPIQKNMPEFLQEIQTMLSQNEHLKFFSLLKNNLDPIFLVACRHYRQPIPLNFII